MNTAELNPAGKPVELASAPAFQLGALHVLPGERLVEGAGVRTELQPRVMQVLVALAEARPRVVSRDQLIERCWGGRIVGDDALNRCILALRNLAKACTTEPFVIETVPRVGHRLIEQPQPAAAIAPKAKMSRRTLVTAVCAALLVCGLVAGAIWRGTAREPATIAVLPFRSLSSENPYFAEGVGEEILDRLAEEPEFRVAGRTSAAQFHGPADVRKVGRALGVDYVIEGTVRSQGDRVRVNASLIKARDGMRLWSQTYDRKLDDIFVIQQAIGASVADALSRRLLARETQPSAVATNGEAYRDFLSARGMLRTRNPELGDNAILLLRQALEADPRYAPAWASLAEASRLRAVLDGHEKVISVLPGALAQARHAIALDPNLAQAHGVLGALLGYRSREAEAHLRRAAALAPHDAEAQLWLATAERVAGNYERELAAYRRAVSLDPHWFRPNRDLGVALAEMGDRAAAERVATTGDFGAANRSALIARVAWLYGDFAQAAQIWSAGAKLNSIWRAPAQVALENARFTLGLPGAAPPRPSVPVAELRPNVGRFWMSGPPTADVWRQRNRSEAAALVYDNENFVAAKLLLNAGRGRELLPGYDGAVGLLGIKRGTPVGAADLASVPLVVLALRQAGRAADADRLLSAAQAQVTAIYRRGRVPFSFDVDAAAIAAVAGDREQAMRHLGQALHRGWSHSAPDDLLRLEDEPAFAGLHGDPRFTAIAAKLAAQIARERQKAIALGL